MAYKARFEGSHNHPRVMVAGREIPKTYQVVFRPDADEEGPQLLLAFEVVDGVPVCTEVRFTRTEHGREVRRRDLEGIFIEDWLEAATKFVSQPLDRIEHDSANGQTVFHLDQRGVDDYGREVRRLRSGARGRGPTDEQLREAAEVYRAADRAPTEAVSKRFNIAHRTASLWIARARQRVDPATGQTFLPPTRRGKSNA